ncbi:CHC2 zinc finger domain-containing protein [Seonamhaeicola sp.]|uniref:CHC2 zinc finger domain-containing protein n=1 Tax=Seonamhaeicola sp. TaxID=1912245 RepID=UPI00260EA0DC|nr:CHC2 zinc finger domain-containing protein [Seonamhaeicola sp.]
MEIAQIKQRLQIGTVLNHYNLKANKNGMLCCPFHKDDKPSLKIYTKTNTFNCFGCAANGDVIEFIQKKENTDKHTAILKAKELLNTSEPEPETATSLLKETHPVVDMQQTFTGLKQSLQRSKKAKDYLQQRSIDLTKHEIGYNSGTTYNRMKYCIIFPLKDRQNKITGFYGRSILDKENAKHFYLKNRSGLYPHYPTPKTTKLILTEAIIDAATLLQIPEITNTYEVLSCYGTNGLTEEHKQAISELKNLKELIFFFDGDKAGEAAVNKYQQELSELLPNIKLSSVETPQGEDVNSLYVNYDQDAILQLLEERKLLIEQNPLPVKGRLNTRNPEFITYMTNELQIVLLGGINLQQLDRLRATIKITRTGSKNPLHSIRHTIDLYHSDYLEKFIGKASEQLETGTTILRTALAELIDQIERYRLNQIESRKEKRPQERKLSHQQEQRAINYLKSPKLMERTGHDIGKTGMVGEENNRLLMYLVFTSRLREQPLHIISLGASGTGKTYLQEKVSQLIPEHHKLEITILSENAFYYFGQQELKNKLVLIEDMDGAENVLYPLRELQSKKKISKTIPIKDSKGNLKTITLKVEGPICLAGTTTREKLYEDNANRSLLIYLDNSKTHKEQIMKYQRKLSAGKINTNQEQEMIERFKDMQTMLKPIKVRNPYAEYLVIPEHVFKPLRTNSHYLAFIETITFYHQYQRRVASDDKTGEKYIETTIEDIEWANKLLKDVLLAKADELSRECRRLFERLKTYLNQNKKTSFYKNEIRKAFRMNPNNLKYYLVQLLRYNYIKIVGGNRHKTGYEYEITNTLEYNELNQSLDNALDAALKNIKQNLVGSVDNKRVTDAVIHSTT